MAGKEECRRSCLLNQRRVYLLGCWIGPWTDLLSGFRKGHSNEGRAQCLGVHLHSGSTQVVILPSLHIGRLVPINQPFLNHTRSYACTDCARLSTVRSARLCPIVISGIDVTRRESRSFRIFLFSSFFPTDPALEENDALMRIAEYARIARNESIGMKQGLREIYENNRRDPSSYVRENTKRYGFSFP